MKRKISILVFTILLCVTVFNGFCQEINFIPLTWEIVGKVRDKLKEGDYFVSKSFSINIKNNTLTFIEGILVPGGENPDPYIIIFTREDIGKLDNIFDYPRGRETLEISYPDSQDKKDIRLRFVRNSNNKNRFELASAMVNTNNYTFRFSGAAPYLIVLTGLSVPRIELKAIPISEARNYPPQSRQGSAHPTVKGNANHGTAENRSGAICIDGQGSLNKSDVIEYIKHKNPNVSHRTIENLVETYFREAGKEGINPDIAIAQMCRTTNFLGIERLMKAHNYAGFSSTPEWPGAFYGMREGVIAHIQHLKGYTSNVRHTELKEPLFDPRWFMLDSLRGTINTLEDLSVKWAPYNSRGYYNDIIDIINGMRRFSSQMDT